MIDRTLSNALAIADIAPKAATKLPDASRGDGAFSEALAGAHTVHDRRESQATSHSRREWAHGDHGAERTRGQDRADEVRSDRAVDRGGEADADEHSVDGSTGHADGVDDSVGRPQADATASASTGTEAETAATDADAQSQAAATISAAATLSTEADAALIVPTTTTTTAATATASVATDAVDAALRLAIDADVTATTVDADVEATLTTTTAPGAEDAEAGDVEAGPMRPVTSTTAATSGPSPVQLGASVAVDATAGDAPVVTSAQVAQVATSGATDVAAGTEADGHAQLVQAAAVDADGSIGADTEVEAGVQVKGARVEVAADDAAAATATLDADADAELLPGATGRANATTHVTNPTAQAQAQVHAQAQSKVAEQAADEAGDSAAAPRIEPTTQPVAAGTRDAQVAAGVRIREGILGGGMQDQIDHIAEQLATRLRLSQAAGGSQVQLSLKPRELGEVTVQMAVREGVVAATILVDKADTLRTMQSNIEDLKRSLENQGLSIQEFSVDVRGDAGAGGANARAAADLRSDATRTSSGSASSVAGAAAVIPGLSGDLEVDPDALHDGDVSVLA